MLSEEQVEAFRAIYKECHHEELSHADTRQMAHGLMLLYERLAKPFTLKCGEVEEGADRTSFLGGRSGQSKESGSVEPEVR